MRAENTTATGIGASAFRHKLGIQLAGYQIVACPTTTARCGCGGWWSDRMLEAGLHAEQEGARGG